MNKEIIYYFDPITGAEDTDKDTVTYSYSNLGNVNLVKTQFGNIPRTVNYAFDTKERFNLITTNPLGYIVTTQYDDRGLLLSRKDPNNVEVTCTYDGLGRLITTNNPDAADQVDSLKWVKAGDGVAPQYALYYHRVNTAGKPYVKTYYDRLGRALRTLTQAQNNKLVYSDVVYNSKGQQVQGSLPYFPGDTVHWNYAIYYEDGRVKFTYIDNNIKKATFTYDKNKVTQTMNNTGQVYTKTYDATGALINATDPGGTMTYSYFSSGNVKSVTAPVSTTTFEYDKYNTQKKLIDPNAGTIEYEYNAYGEVKYQKDAKGNWFRISKIDKAGRPLTKTSSDGSTVNYTYDTDFKGTLYNVAHTNGTSSQYLHDALGRVTTQKETILGQLYTTNFTYDSYSNPLKITYPSAFNINYTYTATGYPSQVKHTDNTIALWSAVDVNALGEWKNFTLGTGINRQFSYYWQGMPSKIETNSVQKLEYSFNKETGNLNYRKDVLKNLKESFTYNTTLDQLTSWKIGSATYNVSYSSDGTSRMTAKTDAGNYVYGSSPAIHRVTGINNNTGSIGNAACTINYTAFNKIDSIFETGNYRLKYLYAADEQRRVSRLYNSSNVKVKETIYVPGGYEVEKIGTVTRKMHYIPLGDSWALYVKNSGGQDSLYFLLTDHLGSVNVITNATGAILKEYSFDPWGRRRNPADWNYANLPAVSITTRGFTMHEHMDKFNYINMNGRVYDPVLGQFLSPDPFISDPSSTMGYNRYAYCNYNPLKFTDPSGYKKCYENEPPQEWWVRVPDMHGYIGYYRGGGGGGFGGGTGFYGRSNSNSGGYHYTGNGTYENSSGESVNYWEVYHNYIVPFASYAWVCVTPRISANEGRTWSYGNGQLVFRPGANINYNSPGVDNASGGGGVIDDATSPFVGLGFKVVEDIGDDIFRGLGSGGKAVNRYYGPAANIWGGYNMVKTANNPNISNTRKAYDLAKNGIPIGIDVAIMFGLLESTPAGWIGTGIGVTMEGAELFYDKVYTPAMNYLLDYSNRWDQWFINGGYTNFYSDQRLKTEITEIDSTLEKLLLLHAYRFKWKTNNTNNDIGLLAQEVESVFPELVFKDSLGYKQIAYHKLVPILLQAIREQDLIIKQQNDSIEKYNQQLKEQEVLLNDVIQRLNKIEKNK